MSTRDKGQDTANQRLQLDQFARKQGWKVVKVYEDRASGGDLQRIGRQQDINPSDRTAIRNKGEPMKWLLKFLLQRLLILIALVIVSFVLPVASFWLIGDPIGAQVVFWAAPWVVAFWSVIASHPQFVCPRPDREMPSAGQRVVVDLGTQPSSQHRRRNGQRLPAHGC